MKRDVDRQVKDSSAVLGRRDPRHVYVPADLGAVHERDVFAVGGHAHDPSLLGKQHRVGSRAFALADDLVSEGSDDIESRVALGNREHAVELVVWV